MGTEPIAELVARVTGHIYWDRKPSFLLSADVYDQWAIFAVEEGEFRYRVGSVSGTAGAGDLVLCPPGEEFGRETVTPLSFHFLHVEWNRPDEEMAALFPKRRIRLADRVRLKSTFGYLRRAARDYPDLRSLNHSAHLLRDLFQLYEMEQEERRAASPLPAPSGDALMDRAAEEIRTLAGGEVSLNELAARLGFSPVQFTRRFRAAYHRLPSDYLRSVRLSEACRMLAETSLTVGEVAERCGYESGFSLSRAFSLRLGTSPSAYRKAHRL